MAARKRFAMAVTASPDSHLISEPSELLIIGTLSFLDASGGRHQNYKF